MVRAFWLLSFRHSSLITQNIPIFTTYRLDTVFTLRNSNISTFLWDPHLITKSIVAVSLPMLTLHFLHFSFPLHPWKQSASPKTQTRTHQNALKLPRLTSSVCTITISEAPSPHLFLLRQVWDFSLSYALLLKFPFFPDFAPSPSPCLVSVYRHLTSFSLLVASLFLCVNASFLFSVLLHFIHFWTECWPGYVLFSSFFVLFF